MLGQAADFEGRGNEAGHLRREDQLSRGVRHHAAAGGRRLEGSRSRIVELSRRIREELTLDRGAEHRGSESDEYDDAEAAPAGEGDDHLHAEQRHLALKQPGDVRTARQHAEHKEVGARSQWPGAL